MQPPVCPQEDPFNAASVKLAEATRVRLYLPGLQTSSIQDERDDGSRGNSDVARRTARKLAKAARYTQPSQDITGTAGGAPQVFVEELGDESDDTSSLGEQRSSGGAAASKHDASGRARSAGTPPGAAHAAAGSQRAGAGSRPAGGALCKQGADTATGAVVPVWERLATPSGGILREKPLSAPSTGGLSRHKKAVVAKTFTIGMASPGGLLRPDNAAAGPPVRVTAPTATSAPQPHLAVHLDRGLEGHALRKHPLSKPPAYQAPAVVMVARGSPGQGHALHVLQQLAQSRGTEHHSGSAHPTGPQQSQADAARHGGVRAETSVHLKVVEGNPLRSGRGPAELAPGATSSLALMPTRANASPVRKAPPATSYTALSSMASRTKSSTGGIGGTVDGHSAGVRHQQHTQGQADGKVSSGPPAAFNAGPRVQAGTPLAASRPRPGASRLHTAHER